MAKTIDFGIDLGTTNSCIARWEAGGLKVFRNNDQMSVTPSAVQLLKSGRVIVGRRAYSALVKDSDNIAIEFKRWMGQKDRKRFPAANRELSAEELSAEVLKSLREDVRRQTGAEVTTAVITVPAAFGALQCEATARAAQLAGLEESPLLQEPIAAAIGYGAQAGSTGKYWMVFDLGGGTLDIAVVSTSGRRMNVLEHRGNNLLGGKDVDRAIVERYFLPALDSTYELTASGCDSARHHILSKLRLRAEEAKIDLSSVNEVTVSLMDLGEDDSGATIDLELTLTRTQLEAVMEPLLEKCCVLAREALAGARIESADLDRIVLVGGPTQSPVLRSMLSARLGAPVDFSADPMTVVGQGAAVYASTLERSSPASVPVKVAASASPVLSVKLAFEPVCATLECTVAGRVVDGISGVEIKVDSQDGAWSSNWQKPVNGLFEVTVPLKEADVATFWVYARDPSGHLLETDSPQFSIRNGFVPSAPPLPHTLSVEVAKAGGGISLDPVFPKGTPLPAEKKLKYRATHALIPDDPTSDLAIKIWEGEYLDDPAANTFVGNVLLSHASVKRRLSEGSEIEVTIQINVSRLISVGAFVPSLRQRFDERLYIPQRDEQAFANLSHDVAKETANYRSRLDKLELGVKDGNSDDPARQEMEQVRRDLDDLEQFARATTEVGLMAEPDDARRVVENSKNVRGRLDRLERAAASNPRLSAARFAEAVDFAVQIVTQFGSSLEKQQLAMLRRQLDQAAEKNDDRSVTRLCEEIEALRLRVLFKHDWFWKEIFESMQQPGTPFADHNAARGLIAQGESAITGGDGEGLRKVVRALWALLPQGGAEATRDRAMRTGLGRF
jgi:molecular chaperone DnaK